MNPVIYRTLEINIVKELVRRTSVELRCTMKPRNELENTFQTSSRSHALWSGGDAWSSGYSVRRDRPVHTDSSGCGYHSGSRTPSGGGLVGGLSELRVLGAALNPSVAGLSGLRVLRVGLRCGCVSSRLSRLPVLCASLCCGCLSPGLSCEDSDLAAYETYDRALRDYERTWLHNNRGGKWPMGIDRRSPPPQKGVVV